MTREVTLKKISECGVVAVIRAQSCARLLNIADALIKGGVTIIEVTMTTPKAISGIEDLVDALGEKAVIGVGTVLDISTCAGAIAAGAEFAVSPVLNTGIIATTRKLGKVSIPGALTPTEIFTAWSAGADIVKVFPSITMGPRYLNELLGPMPFLRLIPTGGVTVENASQWIQAGAAAVGSLVSEEALRVEDWDGITALARQFVDVVTAARAR